MPSRTDALGGPRLARNRILNPIEGGSTMAAKKSSGRKYGKKASEKVEKAMHERKHGTLKSGTSGKTVKSRKQAIAIGLSEARRAGGKVPKKSSSKKGGSKKRSSSK